MVDEDKAFTTTVRKGSANCGRGFSRLIRTATSSRLTVPIDVFGRILANRVQNEQQPMRIQVQYNSKQPGAKEG